MMRHLLWGFAISSPAHCIATAVQGTAMLDGQSDHSQILVTLETSIFPVLTGWNLLIPIGCISLLLFLNRFKTIRVASVCLAVLFLMSIMYADPVAQTTTNSDGSYAFMDIPEGLYQMSFSKDCFLPINVPSFRVEDDLSTVQPVTLFSAIPDNESKIASNLREIALAEILYNNNASPHTYTGTLACLVSGNGAGGEPFLPVDFLDGIVDEYQIQLAHGCGPDANGSYWCWSATAFPVVYNCTGRTSFYHSSDPGSCGICFVKGADIGGGPANESLPLIYEEDGEHEAAYNMLSSIASAETDYNNNSSPHTYTGSLACLASGNGAGNIPFICSDIADGEFLNYRYSMGLDEFPDPNGSYWSWSATAWPVVYGASSVISFYIDETAVHLGADIGGNPGSVSLPPISQPSGPCSEFSTTNPTPAAVGTLHDRCVSEISMPSESKTD